MSWCGAPASPPDAGGTVGTSRVLPPGSPHDWQSWGGHHTAPPAPPRCHPLCRASLGDTSQCHPHDLGMMGLVCGTPTPFGGGWPPNNPPFLVLHALPPREQGTRDCGDRSCFLVPLWDGGDGDSWCPPSEASPPRTQPGRPQGGHWSRRHRVRSWPWGQKVTPPPYSLPIYHQIPATTPQKSSGHPQQPPPPPDPMSLWTSLMCSTPRDSPKWPPPDTPIPQSPQTPREPPEVPVPPPRHAQDTPNASNSPQCPPNTCYSRHPQTPPAADPESPIPAAQPPRSPLTRPHPPQGPPSLPGRPHSQCRAGRRIWGRPWPGVGNGAG